MENQSKRARILICLAAIIVVNLSCLSYSKTWCETIQGGDWLVKKGQDPLDGCCSTEPGCKDEDPDTGNQLTEENACDATRHLSISSSEIRKQETNQFGTKLCEYTLTIHNSAEEEVWVYVYQHNQDGFQNTEDYQWLGNFPIAPGDDTEWVGIVSIYTDQDASGPVMSIPEQLAGVYGKPECANYRMNEIFLESVADDISAVCPME